MDDMAPNDAMRQDRQNLDHLLWHTPRRKSALRAAARCTPEITPLLIAGLRHVGNEPDKALADLGEVFLENSLLLLAEFWERKAAEPLFAILTHPKFNDSSDKALPLLRNGPRPLAQIFARDFRKLLWVIEAMGTQPSIRVISIQALLLLVHWNWLKVSDLIDPIRKMLTRDHLQEDKATFDTLLKACLDLHPSHFHLDIVMVLQSGYSSTAINEEALEKALKRDPRSVRLAHVPRPHAPMTNAFKEHVLCSGHSVRTRGDVIMEYLKGDSVDWARGFQHARLHRADSLRHITKTIHDIAARLEDTQYDSPSPDGILSSLCLLTEFQMDDLKTARSVCTIIRDHRNTSRILWGEDILAVGPFFLASACRNRLTMLIDLACDEQANPNGRGAAVLAIAHLQQTKMITNAAAAEAMDKVLRKCLAKPAPPSSFTTALLHALSVVGVKGGHDLKRVHLTTPEEDLGLVSTFLPQVPLPYVADDLMKISVNYAGSTGNSRRIAALLALARNTNIEAFFRPSANPAELLAGDTRAASNATTF